MHNYAYFASAPFKDCGDWKESERNKHFNCELCGEKHDDTDSQSYNQTKSESLNMFMSMRVMCVSIGGNAPIHAWAFLQSKRQRAVVGVVAVQRSVYKHPLLVLRCQRLGR